MRYLMFVIMLSMGFIQSCKNVFAESVFTANASITAISKRDAIKVIENGGTVYKCTPQDIKETKTGVSLVNSKDKADD